MASSEYPASNKNMSAFAETFQSDGISIYKGNTSKSVFKMQEGLNSQSRRKTNINQLAEQLNATNLPNFGSKPSIMTKIDSVYSSNNVPTIKDIKYKNMRPMSMKHPRKLRQKIDQKFINRDDIVSPYYQI